MKPSQETFNEQIRLFGLRLTVQAKNFAEFLRVAFRYYSNFSFCKIDLSLLVLYCAYSPFAISKKFLSNRKEADVYTYGETPLTTMDFIAKECQFTAQDTLFELGCGRGRTCFWLNAFIGCRVVGIDYIPEFIHQANAVKKRFGVAGVEFRLQDMLQADLIGATVIYLYGTCLSDEAIQRLIERFAHLPAGTKIVTVSFSLNEYTSEPYFEVMKRFTAAFPWGSGDVYLHIKK